MSIVYVKPDCLTKRLLRLDYFFDRLCKYRFRCSWPHVWRTAGDFSNDVRLEGRRV